MPPKGKKVTGSFDKGTISNFQGQKGTIKLGIACQAKIVSRKEKMLYFILDKMGIDTSRWQAARLRLHMAS